MGRGIAHAIFAAAAGGAAIATFGLTAAGTAGAATGSVQVHNHHFAGFHSASLVVVGRHFAGYDTASSETWRFRSVATTVSVAACQIPVSPVKNPAVHIELFGGTHWSADIEMLCKGGAGSVGFFDQKSATTHAQGLFRLSPHLGDRVRIRISRNVANHRDSFTATNLRTGRSQTVRVTTSTAVVYHHAFVGSVIGRNADVMPLPATSELLWTFQNSRVATNGGLHRTLRGPWTTVKEIDRTSAGVTVMYPGKLSSDGASFSTLLAAAP